VPTYPYLVRMSTVEGEGMSENTKKSTLTRDKVLAEAIELADEIGFESLTIRNLADRLGVGAMTIYHHVPSKDEIIDGMVEIVFGEIEKPPTDTDWKSAIRQRCFSARKALNRHTWAAPLMESRTSPGPTTLSHHDAVIGCLRNGGLSIQMTAHAYATLDSFVYGFALEEASLPAGDSEGIAEVAEQIAAQFPADEYPHLAELTFNHVLKPGYHFGDSFEFGLDLIIDGLERAAKAN
jgi:AcrR family transcriptional regulator